MVEVKILIEGYGKEKEDCELVSCSTVLIKDKGKNIIVDPGMNKPKLIEALKKEHLNFKDINYVILTHTDTDHMLLTALFENARVIDCWSIYTFDGKIVEHKDKVPGTSIELIKTQGHHPSHTSVIVKTEKGTIVVAGDVFWWWDHEEQKTDRKSLMEHEDPYVKNKEELLDSRKKVLKIADYIIPGHGKMFKVNK